MKRYGYSILVVGFLSVGRLIAQTGDAADVVHLTLTDAIALTLENSFQIRISQNNLRIANTNNHIGNAGMLPIVSANASVNRSRLNAEQEFLDGRIVPVDNGNRQVVNAGVNMNWRLFDGTRMFATLSRLQQEAIASNLQLKIQIDNTLGQMLQSYYRVAVEQERLALFQSNVMFSEERVRIVDEKYKVGKESKLSLLQAKVDLNSDRSSLVQQRELLVGQKLALVQLMGVDPFDFEVQFQFSIDNSLILSELEAAAATHNPMLQMQQSNKQIQDLQVKELNRGRLPQLDLNIGYGYGNLQSDAGFLVGNESFDFNYGLSATVNLFSGFNQMRNIQNAQVALENSQLLQQEAEQMIVSNLLNAFTAYRNNLELLELESENLEVANENSEIALERFRLGVSDALALREAQVNAVNARIRLLQSQFNAKAAEVELYRLSGKLTESVK